MKVCIFGAPGKLGQYMVQHALDRDPTPPPAAGRVAVHAVALRALLAEAPSVLSPAERQLLNDWLHRLADCEESGPIHTTRFRRPDGAFVEQSGRK